MEWLLKIFWIPSPGFIDSSTRSHMFTVSVSQTKMIYFHCCTPCFTEKSGENTHYTKTPVINLSNCSESFGAGPWSIYTGNHLQGMTSWRWLSNSYELGFCLSVLLLRLQNCEFSSLLRRYDLFQFFWVWHTRLYVCWTNIAVLHGSCWRDVLKHAYIFVMQYKQPWLDIDCNDIQ